MQVNKDAKKEEQVLKYFLPIQILMIDKNILLKKWTNLNRTRIGWLKTRTNKYKICGKYILFDDLILILLPLYFLQISPLQYYWLPCYFKYNLKLKIGSVINYYKR